jgi:ubiquitin-like domain-containing CTD phosphatase 1
MLVEPLEGPDVIDDFEIAAEEERAIQHRDENLMKLRRRIEQYKVSGRHP